MNLFKRENGQVTVLTAIFIVGLLGITGIVLDVGSWFRQQRASQTTVDSAALAAAQMLPRDPTTARTLAVNYANANGGVAGATITIGSRYEPDDQVTVSQATPADGFFSNLFGISTVTVHAHATAISEVPSAVLGVAPIVVDIHQQMLSGPGCPCYQVPTRIDLGKKGVPGAFGMLDLANSGGNTGTSTVANWVTNGYSQYLPLGNYDSDPGSDFTAGQVQQALKGRFGTDLLFPVYDSLSGQGSNAPYNIIGWASFHLQDTQAAGNNGSVWGYFDNVIWDGIVPANGKPNPNIPDLGVRSVALVD